LTLTAIFIIFTRYPPYEKYRLATVNSEGDWRRIEKGAVMIIHLSELFNQRFDASSLNAFKAELTRIRDSRMGFFVD